MKAIARQIRITSKKLNLIAELVRRKNVSEAMSILKFTPKKAAKILYKVIHSAVANAENNFKQDRPSLFIQEIVVTEGPTLKRSVPVSRGRVNPILKRTAHVTVTLNVKSEEDGVNSASKPNTASAKKSETTKKITQKKKITTVKA